MNIKPNLVGRLRAAGSFDRTIPLDGTVLRDLCAEAADEIEALRNPSEEVDVTHALNGALASVWRDRTGKGLDDLGEHLQIELRRRGYVVAVQCRPLALPGSSQS